MEAMFAWILTFLLIVAPPGLCKEPACFETPEEYEQRLEQIIDAAASVVYDENEKPLYGGPWGREESLMHVLAVAHHESISFRKDVDNGQLRGDKGGSGCLMGIMVGEGGKAEGWTLRQLTQERRLCFSVGYHRMKMSVATCGKNIHGLAVYASGRCDWGRKESREMVRQGYRWFGKLKTAWEKDEW